MRNDVKLFFLTAVFCFCGPDLLGQGGYYPPPPDDSEYMHHTTGPCGNTLEHDEDGNPISPPPGLCMPINDYLIPLLIIGIILGAYKVHEIQLTDK